MYVPIAWKEAAQYSAELFPRIVYHLASDVNQKRAKGFSLYRSFGFVLI